MADERNGGRGPKDGGRAGGDDRARPKRPPGGPKPPTGAPGREDRGRPGARAEAERRNLRATVEYLGDAFAGWEDRPGARTAGAAFAEALAAVLRERPVVVSSDRPEPGVHVEGLVVNFLTRNASATEELERRLARALPDDLGLVSLADAPADFHSRRKASAHVYRYEVAQRPSVFLRGRAWHVGAALNHRTLTSATKRIIGLHDFAAFCPGDLPAGLPTKAKIHHAAWKQSRDVLVLRLSASHVPAGMLLGVVGALVGVASGAIPRGRFTRWLDRPQPGARDATAPPHGAYLDHVEYDGAAEPEPEKTAGRRPSPPRQRMAPAARRALDAMERARGTGGDGAASATRRRETEPPPSDG